MSMTQTLQSAPAGTWSADPVHSDVSFEVAYAGTNTFRGAFRDFTATLADGRLQGSVKVASVDVKDGSSTATCSRPTSSTPGSSRRSRSARAT